MPLNIPLTLYCVLNGLNSRRGWLLLARYSDMMVLCVLAVLISLTVLCLFAPISVFRRHRERTKGRAALN